MAQEGEEEDNIVKVILVGESNVGKTSLINVFLTGKFEEKVMNTTSASCIHKKLTTDISSYSIMMWDTAGQEKFRSINKIFIKESKIVIFVYDIIRRSTFEEIPWWVNYVKELLGDEAIFGLVGNKADLFDKEEEIKEQKKEFDLVDKKEASNYAEQIGALFIETSAKEDSKGFNQFITKIVKEYEKLKKPKKRSSFSLKKTKIKKKRKCC